jgi:hypothetical protein
MKNKQGQKYPQQRAQVENIRGHYYTNKEDTSTRSGQVDDVLVREKILKMLRNKQFKINFLNENLINFNGK